MHISPLWNIVIISTKLSSCKYSCISSVQAIGPVRMTEIRYSISIFRRRWCRYKNWLESGSSAVWLTWCSRLELTWGWWESRRGRDVSPGSHARQAHDQPTMTTKHIRDAWGINCGKCHIVRGVLRKNSIHISLPFIKHINLVLYSPVRDICVYVIGLRYSAVSLLSEVSLII